MQEINWLEMLAYKEELNALSRNLLVPSQNKTLTNSELELLSLIYLAKEKATPLELSNMSGMKKEAVSRSLKKLFELETINKIKNQDDERSYSLKLTAKGNALLNENYEIILKPFYELYRLMGDDFIKMFSLLKTANQYINTNRS